MDSERMLFSGRPREENSTDSYRVWTAGHPPHVEIVTGKDDEVCNWQVAQKFSTYEYSHCSAGW